MKYLITILAITFFGMATPAEEREDNRIYGIWRSMDNDFIQIWKSWDSEEVKFQRISSNRMLQAKGQILFSEEGELEIKRDYPMNEVYTSDYAFSPSGETLVVMKPNGEQAWVLEKVD